MQDQKQLDESWKSRIVTIRKLQNDDGTVPVTVTDWSLTEDKEHVDVTFEVESLNESYTDRFSSPKINNRDTLLEELIHDLGYDINTMEMIQIERPKTVAEPTQENQLSIKKHIKKSGNSADNIQKNRIPTWVKNSRDNKTGISIIVGLAFGFLAAPVLAKALYSKQLDRGFTHSSIATVIACSMVNIATIFLLTGIYFF